jgi:hypothetical protein
MSDEQKPKEVKPIIVMPDAALYRAFIEALTKDLEAIRDEGKLKDEGNDDEDI